MPRLRLPLQTLPTFLTVARLSNLRAAAEELHLTHSAVSQQIRLLEEQLGFALFERRGRRIALNAAGIRVPAFRRWRRRRLRAGGGGNHGREGKRQQCGGTDHRDFSSGWGKPRT